MSERRYVSRSGRVFESKSEILRAYCNDILAERGEPPIPFAEWEAARHTPDRDCAPAELLIAAVERADMDGL